MDKTPSGSRVQMDLIDVRYDLGERKYVPLNDLALHFPTDVRSIKPVLEVWVASGEITPCRRIKGMACRACRACDKMIPSPMSGPADETDGGSVFTRHFKPAKGIWMTMAAP